MKFVAVSLIVLMLLATSPVSIAEVTAANIGSVSAVGSVQLRGVGISDGTLFSGDRINVSSGGYAKVVLSSGTKIELDGNSDIVVSKNGDTTNIEMKSGNIAFSGGQKSVRVQVGAFDVTASGSARATVAYVGSGAFGIHVIDGTVNVRDTATKQTYTAQKGTERLFSLTDSTQNGNVRLASSGLPTSIPPAPSMPRQSSGGKRAALLIGTVLGSAAAIAVLITKNNDSDSDAAARLKKAQLLNNVTAVSETAAEVKATATQIASVTGNALAVINNNPTINTPANANAKAALVASANATISKANTAANLTISLQAQINQLEAQIEASGTITQGQQDQLDSLLSQLEAARKQANDALNDLDKLINDANNLAGGNIINDPNLDPVDGPNLGSPSNP
jgi:hypothetical protein